MAQWNPVNPGLAADWRAVASSGSEVLIGGDQGIYRSTDQGQTWALSAYPTATADSLALRRALVYDLQRRGGRFWGIAYDTVANQALIIERSFFTNRWEIQYRDSSGRVPLAQLPGELVVGEQGLILSYDNLTGGWQSINLGLNRDLRSAVAIGSDYWLVGGDSILLRRPEADTAQTWLSQPWEGIIYAFLVNQSEDIMILGGDSLWTSSDTLQTRQYFERFNGPLQLTTATHSSGVSLLGGSQGSFRYNVGDALLEWQPASASYSFRQIGSGSFGQLWATTTDGQLLQGSNGGGEVLPYVGLDLPPGLCAGSTQLLLGVGEPFNDYQWFINDTLIGSGLSESYFFAQPDTYQIRLTVSNGTYSDSIAADLIAFAPPSDTQSVEVPDELFCKSAATFLLLPDSDSSLDYVWSIAGTSVGQLPGNGDTLALPTGLLIDSTWFQLTKRIPQSACAVTVSDSFLVRVENLAPEIGVNWRNAPPDTGVYFVGRSALGSSFSWDFGPGAQPGQANQLIPPAVSYAQPGLKPVQFVVQTDSGCVDTAQGPALGVVNPAAQPPQWLLTLQRLSPLADSIAALRLDVSAQGLSTLSGRYDRWQLDSRAGLNQRDSARGSFAAQYDSVGVLRWWLRSPQPQALGLAALARPGHTWLGGIAADSTSFLLPDGRQTLLPADFDPQDGWLGLLQAQRQWLGWLRWAKGQPQDLAVGPDGGAWVAGRLTGSNFTQIDLIGDSLGAPAGAAHAYLTRLDSAGHGRWIAGIGGSALAPDTRYRVSVSPQGLAYLAGSYQGSATLYAADGSAQSLPPTSGDRDLFLACFGPDGGLRWWATGARDSSGAADRLTSLRCDAQGRIYLLGQVGAGAGAYRFATGDSLGPALPGAGMVLAAWDSSGRYRWGLMADHGVQGDELALASPEALWVAGQSPDTSRLSSTDGLRQGVPATCWLARYDSLGRLQRLLALPDSVGVRPLGLGGSGAGALTLLGGYRLADGADAVALGGGALGLAGSHAFLTRFRPEAAYPPPLTARRLAGGARCAGDSLALAYAWGGQGDSLASVRVFLTAPGQAPQLLYQGAAAPLLDTLRLALPLGDYTGSEHWALRVEVDSPQVIGPILPLRMLSFLPDRRTDLVFCPGETVQLQADTGTVFLWQPGLAVGDSAQRSVSLSPDTTVQLTVAITQTCGVRVDTFVLRPQGLSVAPEVVVCAGDTLTLTARGAEQYLWQSALPFTNPADSVARVHALSSDFIYLTSRDSAAGCTVINSVFVKVPVIPTDAPELMGDTLVALPGYDYQWFVDGFELLSARGQQKLLPLVSGAYQVRLIGEGSCGALSDPQPVDLTDILSLGQPGWQLFPNPAQQQVTLAAPQPQSRWQVRVWSRDGRLCHEASYANTQTAHWSLSGWSSGLYWVEVEADGQRSWLPLSVIASRP